ncbi:hypothetical protein H6503_04670 [Candidatus Woesearchaeota archaeon]|nr:hypothetical protein [Candidatus Woesearchaeota archaeon]
MAAPLYKQRCWKCKKNFVKTNYRNRYPICYECEKAELDKPIEDPKLKKLLDIPEEFYKENAFLRDIKINAIKWGNLSERQIEAFQNSVKKMEEAKKEAAENPKEEDFTPDEDAY